MVETQVWADFILEGLIPDTAFLSRGQNMNQFVDHNKINLAEAGVDPEVYIDRKGDIDVVSREDIPLELALHTFATQNTQVQNIEEKETAYAKMDSVIRGHRRALLIKESSFAAHNWSPSVKSDFNPVLAATGALNVKTGFKRLSFEDILTLHAQYLLLEVDMDSLNLVLHPLHLADLMAEDMKLYKEMFAGKKIFNFNQFSFSKNPIYDGTTGVKKAMGAAAMGATDAISSFSFVDTEVMHASGSIEAFIKEKCPITRGDTLGYQHRFTALPLRNKYMGAIYTPKG